MAFRFIPMQNPTPVGMDGYCGRIMRNSSSISHSGIPSNSLLSRQKSGKLQMVPQVVNGVVVAIFSFAKIGSIRRSNHSSGTSTSVFTRATWFSAIFNARFTDGRKPILVSLLRSTTLSCSAAYFSRYFPTSGSGLLSFTMIRRYGTFVFSIPENRASKYSRPL